MSQLNKFSQGKAMGKTLGPRKNQKTKNNQLAFSCPSKKIRPNEDRSLKLKNIQEQRKQLPIYHHMEPLTTVIKQSKSLVIVGEPGSGKTTQIPQFIDAANLNKGAKIAVTQPRRVAAISVASRVAQEYGKEVSLVCTFAPLEKKP